MANAAIVCVPNNSDDRVFLLANGEGPAKNIDVPIEMARELFVDQRRGRRGLITWAQVPSRDYTKAQRLGEPWADSVLAGNLLVICPREPRDADTRLADQPRCKRDRPLSAQTFGNMLRNRIYIGHIESPEIAVSARGDFEPLIDEATFYRAQAVLDGRVPVATPRQRNHPDFPLRGFVRCETCGRPLTGSWSKGRNGRYAYYHCPRRCRAVNVSKAALEGAFVDELALLQPTPGYMRLVKDRVLCVWGQECAAARERAAEQERRLKAVRLKLDRLDEAFLYSESIDLDTYSRQRDKLREELTLSKIDYHTDAVEELDVEGILAFAERILPRAADLWVQASLDYRQRLQELFFPEGIAYDGNRFNRTAVTALLFRYLEPDERAESKLASPMPASWNQIVPWLRQIDGLRAA